MLRTLPSDKQNIANAQKSAVKPRILQVLCQKMVFCGSTNKKCTLRSNITEPGEIVLLVCQREEDKGFIFWEHVFCT